MRRDALRAPGLPRSAEVALALGGLVAVAPILALAGAAVRVTSPGPVLFRQARVGQGGRLVTLYKLRTMRVAQAGAGVTRQGDARITPVGRLLRATKADELPELWNVVRGDLALVGPRPELPEFVDLQDRTWQAVLRERPGITHPVTIELRNEEALLASVPGETSAFYRTTLLPYKLAGYLRYQGVRNTLSNLGVLAKTGLTIFWPSLSTPPSLETLNEAVRPRVAVRPERSAPSESAPKNGALTMATAN